MPGYTRARPTGTWKAKSEGQPYTPVRKVDLEKWDQAIFDLKYLVQSAKDYGTVGDGVANDTAALQSAIDNVPSGGALFIPSGIYKITAALSVTKPISIIGAGYSDSTSLGSIISVSGAINGITVGVGGQYSVFQNFHLIGDNSTSIHGISVTGAAGIGSGTIRNVFAENFKAGAGFYLGNNAEAWTLDACYAQGNRYGFKLEATSPFNCNNHVLIHPEAVNNATAGNVGTQFQIIGVNGLHLIGPLSEVTNTTSTVEGFDIQGCLSILIEEPYVEHSNTGKAVKIGKNGATFSEDVRFVGGTWQSGVLVGGSPNAFNISLEGDRRTQILVPNLSLSDETANQAASDNPILVTLSTATYEPTIQGSNLWKVRIVDNGAVNPEILDNPERYRRAGGLYETLSKTNLCYWSEKISNWVVNGNITVTDNQATSPDGIATSASKVTRTVGGAGDDHVRLDSLVNTGGVYTFSVWLKADTAHRANIYIVENGVGTQGSRTVNVGTTWRRFFVTGTCSGVGFVHMRVQPVASVDTNTGYAYVWGAQLEVGSLSDYIPANAGAYGVRPAGFSTSKRATFGGGIVQRRIQLTYGATVNIDASLGNHFEVTANNGTAFTIAAPTNPVDGQRIKVKIRNTSGGALGVVTWNAVFKLAAWTNPATGNSRSIDFDYDGTNWVEAGRTTVDVPN